VRVAALIDKVVQSFFRPVTRVGFVLCAALGEEVERGVRLNAIALGDWTVGCCVGIVEGNDAIFVVLKGLCDNLELGLERLSVATPRSSECNESILLCVESNLVKAANVKLEQDRRRRRLRLFAKLLLDELL